MSRTVFLSPFTNPGNTYIDMHRQLLGTLGFEVRPLTLRQALSPRGLAELYKRDNLVIVHWLETRPFLNPGPRRQIRADGMLAFCAYLLILTVARARTLQVIHNHHAHDTRGVARWLSARLRALVSACVGGRIVHDPASASRYRAHYLPHPLYWNRPDAPQNPDRARPRHTQPLFGLLGCVRPYKGIHAVLPIWPAGASLLIAGSSDAAYATQLQALIAAHDLTATVTLDLRFLSESDFDACLDRIDVLLLPHVADSVLVSGLFFQCAGRVPLILIRSSPFGDWVATQMPGIQTYRSDAELLAHVQRIRADWPLLDGIPQPQTPAVKLFGWQTCCQAYASFLGDACQRQAVVTT